MRIDNPTIPHSHIYSDKYSDIKRPNAYFVNNDAFEYEETISLRITDREDSALQVSVKEIPKHSNKRTKSISFSLTREDAIHLRNLLSNLK